MLGGAFVDVEKHAGATFVFNVDDSQEIEDFVQNDPYYLNGLVTSYEIKEMSVAIPPQQ